MSASPEPVEVEDQQKSKKVTFRFCRECSNILYPKEDREGGENRLIFQCRTCTGHEEAENACIYRNEMSNTAGETAGITQDVGQDPTVGDSDSQHQIAPSSYASDPPVLAYGALSVPEFCTMCGLQIYCETCGNPSDGGCLLEVEEDSDDEMVMDYEDPMSSDSSAAPSIVPTRQNSTRT